MGSYHLANSTLLLLAVVLSLANSSLGSRKLSSLFQPPPNLLTYHNGSVLQGDISISIVWYGSFTATQKSIISDFLLSLTSTSKASNPSVHQWWSTIDELYLSKALPLLNPVKAQILLAGQVSDEKYSMGKSLKEAHISKLVSMARPKKGGIALVFTANDVSVEEFCAIRCGSHGYDRKTGTAYIWVGNSATQCPGHCAWPFHRPVYGPQNPPLVAPNGDVGVDGMVINLASMIAGTVTNPFGDGFFQGKKKAPLEAATACPGVFGKGAYPGYAGDLLLDRSTGASYNANGARGRKFLLPALFNPMTSVCFTLV